MSSRLWIPLLLLGAALAGIGIGRLFLERTPGTSAPVALESGTWFSPPQPLPDFALVDQNGAPAGPGVFKGRWTLVFFGFTHCPEACPTALALLASLRRELAGSLPAEQLPAVLLVTVDPERDTPAVLKAYMEAFDPTFLALYTTPEKLATLAKDFKLYYKKVEGQTPTSYSVDHSAANYVYDTRGKLRLYSRYGSGAQPLMADIRLLLETR